jgi:hypothetical protein
LLLKIDMVRDFNSVAWPFLLEILVHMGFPNGWWDWISVLLSSASTKVLFNGEPGERIHHAHGLHKGDPVSPMLFILIMEVHSALIRAANNQALLQGLQTHLITHHASLYADDLIVFLRLAQHDRQLLRGIFDLFQGASGLAYNLSKC